MNRFFLAAIVSTIAFSSSAQNYASPDQIPAKVFAQMPRMSDVALSPDGTYIAYMMPKDGRNHIVIQPLGDGKAVSIPPMEKFDMRWMRWANNERLVFSVGFSSKRWSSQSQETRLLSIDRAGTDLQQIVIPDRKPSSVKLSAYKPITPQYQDNVIDWLIDDPKHILVSLDGNFDGKWEVREIDVSNGQYRIARAGLSGVQRWMTDSDGKVRLGWGYSGPNFDVRYLAGGGGWNRAKRTDWFDKDYMPVAFTENNNEVFAIGPDEEGVRVLRRLDIVEGTLGDIVIGDARYDVGRLIYDAVTDKPVGVRVGNTPSGVKFFDELYSKMQRSMEKAQSGNMVHIASMSADRRKVVVKASSDRDPGVFYLWDRNQKTMDVFSETMPGIDPEQMATMEQMSYPARDGTSIEAYVTAPVGKERSRLPTVILPHGGPHHHDVKRFSFLAQFIASRGYLVLQPNFRGSTGYGKDFQDAGENQWGGLMQDDVTDGAKWLVDEGVSDPDRMCIAGWSYGGYAAAMGAVKTPDLYQCAVSINGVFDLPGMINNDQRYIGGSDWTKSIGLDGERSKAVSPYHRAQEIKVPMLIVHAKDDLRVPILQADSMAKKMKKLNKDVTYVEVDFGGHSMTNEAARLHILENLDTFLKTHLN